MVQLEQLKRMGPMEPVEAKPVPCGENIMAFIAIGKTLCDVSNNCWSLKSRLCSYRYRLPSDSDVMQMYSKLPVIWYQGI
jgi:hypothetical protein